MQIIVNGKVHPFHSTGPNGSRISYETLAKMAGYDSARILTVIYHILRKDSHRSSGSLCHGDITQVEDGMIFNVSDTSGA